MFMPCSFCRRPCQKCACVTPGWFRWSAPCPPRTCPASAQPNRERRPLVLRSRESPAPARHLLHTSTCSPGTRCNTWEGCPLRDHAGSEATGLPGPAGCWRAGESAIQAQTSCNRCVHGLGNRARIGCSAGAVVPARGPCVDHAE